ncbi:MAG: hypothetical protein MZV49_06705 [Rhodopseudomonas palustris]|nr:hypothetical protein [Rhodopseudomonas palustris]
MLGSEVVGLLAGLAAVGSTLLMIHFLRRVAAGASPAFRCTGRCRTRLALAAGLFLAALLLPWMLAPAAGIRPGGGAGRLVCDLVDGLWPVLAGGVLALALQRWGERLPRVPPKATCWGCSKMRRSGRMPWAKGPERTETRLRQWPVAGVLLLVLTLLLWTVALDDVADRWNANLRRRPPPAGDARNTTCRLCMSVVGPGNSR